LAVLAESHAIDILNGESPRFGGPEYTVKLLVKVVDRIPGIAPSGLREALARIATDEEFRSGETFKIPDVTALYYWPQVVAVGSAGGFGDVIRPNDFETQVL
jgi:hypothetical protein